MSMQVDHLEVEDAADGVMVRFRKTLRLGEDNIPSIAAELFRVAQRLGPRTLSLDLGRVVFVTSHALGELVSLHTKVQAGSGRLVLCNVSPTVYEVFEVTRLHTLMDINPPRVSMAPRRNRNSLALAAQNPYTTPEPSK